LRWKIGIENETVHQIAQGVQVGQECNSLGVCDGAARCLFEIFLPGGAKFDQIQQSIWHEAYMNGASGGYKA